MRYSKAAHTLSVVGVLLLPMFLIIPAVLGMKHVGVDLFDQNYTGLISSVFIWSSWLSWSPRSGLFSASPALSSALLANVSI